MTVELTGPNAFTMSCCVVTSVPLSCVVVCTDPMPAESVLPPFSVERITDVVVGVTVAEAPSTLMIPSGNV